MLQSLLEVCLAQAGERHSHPPLSRAMDGVNHLLIRRCPMDLSVVGVSQCPRMAPAPTALVVSLGVQRKSPPAGKMVLKPNHKAGETDLVLPQAGEVMEMVESGESLQRGGRMALVTLLGMEMEETGRNLRGAGAKHLQQQAEVGQTPSAPMLPCRVGVANSKNLTVAAMALEAWVPGVQNPHPL